MRSVFIFRRDLRLEDNTGLLAALSQSEVIPVFVFDPRQVEDNEYKSRNAVQFMLESLKDLDRQLRERGSRLYTFEGRAEDVVKRLCSRADAVFVNRDYTPFSKKRDAAIAKACENEGVDFRSFSDYLLHGPELVKTGKGTPYKVFSAFYRKCRETPVRKSSRCSSKNFFSGKLSVEEYKTDYENGEIHVHGGRSNALKILKGLGKFDDYEDIRDLLTEPTTSLSAHLKFGTVSTREVFEAVVERLGPQHELIRQLFWRDFFTYVAFHNPRVFGKSFYKKYDKLRWEDDKKKFSAWCEGRTGFPIVDAAMRQLNRTGYMQNRARMTVASFLTKDLHVDWRKGEKYFAQKLVDYDPSVNNGNWQWCASTGCDAQPYFRIFNPWSQQKKFDAECKFIKEWIPELKGLKPSAIHKWHKQDRPVNGYPLPIVDHDEEREVALKWYKRVQ